MDRKVIVKKYGGTSVGSIERIGAVADRLLEDYNSGQMPIVVVSAMSGETNRLVELAQQIDPFYRGPAYDLLVASGEQVSVGLVSMALEKRGVKTQPLLAFQLGIETDSVYSKARIINIRTKELQKLINQGTSALTNLINQNTKPTDTTKTKTPVTKEQEIKDNLKEGLNSLLKPKKKDN